MSATVVLTETELDLPCSITSNGMPVDDGKSDRDTETIIFNDCCSGLGIKIIGGISEDEEDDRDFGIFIRKVLPGGLAHQDGRIQEGDQVIEVNGENLESVTNNRAVSLLRQASSQNYVELIVCRNEDARDEYLELLDAYTYSSASSVCERQSISSRASTPSVHSQQWGDTLSPTFSSASQHRTSPYGQTGDHTGTGSSCGSEHDLTLTQPSPPMIDATPAPRALHLQPKIPNAAAAAASMHRQGGLAMPPAMASTPHDASGYSTGIAKPSPDGASGLSPNAPAGLYEPSPVIGSELHTRNGLVSSEFGSTHNSAHAAMSGQSISPGQSAQSSPNSSHSQKLSLDPHVRLRVEKLEMALHYLGIDPTDEQKAVLRKKLNLDYTGSVTYGEFVRAARDIFKFQLEDRNISQGAMMYASGDFRDFTEPPAFRPEMSHLKKYSDTDNDEVERLRKENEKLKREVSRLKEKERQYLLSEDELLRVRQEAQGAIIESRSLRSKYHLAEQAQRAARNMEQDYEEVVRLLEKEIAELRANQSKELDSPAVQKRLAVLGCQLRKAEVSKKTYEVATEKLLQFVETVHVTLSGQDSMSRPSSSHGELVPGEPPGYLAKHRWQASAALATEAREVVKAVKSIIEVEPMSPRQPFGTTL